MATKKSASKAKAAPKAKAATKTKAAAPKKSAAAPKKKKELALTKDQIMTAIAEGAGITKVQARAAYDTLLAVAYAGGKSDKGILLPGLGKVTREKRARRTGRNPRTGETITIPAKMVAKFRLAKACKDAVESK